MRKLRSFFGRSSQFCLNGCRVGARAFVGFRCLFVVAFVSSLVDAQDLGGAVQRLNW